MFAWRPLAISACGLFSSVFTFLHETDDPLAELLRPSSVIRLVHIKPGFKAPASSLTHIRGLRIMEGIPTFGYCALDYRNGGSHFPDYFSKDSSYGQGESGQIVSRFRRFRV